MKRIILSLLTLSLVISLAVPPGAAFALEVEEQGGVVVENEEVFHEQDIEELDDMATSEASIPYGEPSDNDLEEEAVETLPAESVYVSTASSLVITELQTRGAGGASSELIELFNASYSEIDVTDWCVQYASAAGASFASRSCIVSEQGGAETRVILPARSYVVLVTDDFMVASSEFMRDGKLSGSMADAGGRIRLVDALGNVVDLLGWGSASESEFSPALAVPASGQLRSLQRVVVDGEYQDTDNNAVDFEPRPVKTAYQSGALYEVIDVCSNVIGLQIDVPSEMWRLESGACVDKASINFCEDVQLTEIAANVARQYIEISNNSSEAVSLAGCSLMTNRSQSTRALLSDVELQPGEYLVVYIDETPLRLTKSTNGTVYLMASDSETEVDVVYYEDLSSDTSWSRFADDWRQTYTLTPGQANEYAQYASCQVGYWRNEETGRCNKIAEPVVPIDCGEGRERNPVTGRCRNIVQASTLTPCKEGQYRSEETNRCRSIFATVNSLKPCADDQFRSPETNRCRKIASAEELADCGEGRERNPETNRCRNVLTATMPQSSFAVKPITQTTQGTLGWWVFGGVSLLAVGYAGWQWRFEARQLIQKIRGAVSFKAKK